MPSTSRASRRCHLNNVAYMQHRYWRAAEPDRFRDELSLTDHRFFGTVTERKAYEAALRELDRAQPDLDRLVPRGAARVAGDDDGPGDRHRARPEAARSGARDPQPRRRAWCANASCSPRSAFPDAKVLTQMNPDVSPPSPTSAGRARRRGAARLVRASRASLVRGGSAWAAGVPGAAHAESGNAGETLPPIRHSHLTGFQAPFERHVQEHPTNDQSTGAASTSRPPARLLRGSHLEMVRPEIPVTDIAPTILSWFGIGPQPWMSEAGRPAIEVH
jgi:hypothetical protein